MAVNVSAGHAQRPRISWLGRVPLQHEVFGNFRYNTISGHSQFCVERLKLAGPCLSLTADEQPTAFRPAIDSKRTDENTTGFSFTAAARDGYFTFLGTCWSLDATLREKSP